MNGGKLEHDWLVRAAVAFWVITVFSNTPIYLGLFVAPTIQPINWYEAEFCFGILALVLARGSRITIPRQLVFASSVYAVLNLGYFVALGGGDTEVLRGRFLELLLLLWTAVLVSQSATLVQVAKKSVLAVVLMSVALNAWDITHPFTFVPLGSELSNVGRAAGLYVNANQAGAALILGLLLSLDVVPTRGRWAYLVVVALGVVLTLSRGAMLGLLISLALMLALTNTVRHRDVWIAAGTVAAVIGSTWAVVLQVLKEQFHVDPNRVLSRVLWLTDPTVQSDFSQTDRVVLIERGWQQFLSSPLLGNGVGSTEYWELSTSTHNQYLQLASDFGVVGFLILPFIVLSITYKSWSSSGSTIVVGLFTLYWGFVSHNVLSEPYFVVALGIAAADGLIKGSNPTAYAANLE